MGERAIIDRLIRENPLLHFITPETARYLREGGLQLVTGPVSWAVKPDVIRYLAEVVNGDHLTLETGVGHTTIALAGLAKHHVCITFPDPQSIGRTQSYLDRVGIPRAKVTFLLGSSDTVLPGLCLPQRVDFAFIDGCHGYPFPALDWHFTDLNLKVGGIVGFDNTEIKSVQNHCAFLEQNGSYRLVKRIIQPRCCTSFFTKLKDEEREWIFQAYNHSPR
jgi:hypothetical protein